MTKTIDEYDFANPPGYRITFTRGWTIAHDTPETVKDVPLGQGMQPQRFEVIVRATTDDDDFWGVLMFLIADGEIRLAAILSPNEDADVAADRIRALRPIAWWKRKALISLVLDKAVDYTEMVSSIYQATFGMNAADASQWTDKWLYNQMQSAADVPVTRRRDRVTDSMLQETAQVYRAAWEAGDNPTQAVAKHFGKTHSTAARYVGLARKSHHLGPANGSKGGEKKDVAADRP